MTVLKKFVFPSVYKDVYISPFVQSLNLGKNDIRADKGGPKTVNGKFQLYIQRRIHVYAYFLTLKKCMASIT